MRADRVPTDFPVNQGTAQAKPQEPSCQVLHGTLSVMLPNGPACSPNGSSALSGQIQFGEQVRAQPARLRGLYLTLLLGTPYCRRIPAVEPSAPFSGRSGAGLRKSHTCLAGVNHCPLEPLPRPYGVRIGASTALGRGCPAWRRIAPPCFQYSQSSLVQPSARDESNVAETATGLKGSPRPLTPITRVPSEYPEKGVRK